MLGLREIVVAQGTGRRPLTQTYHRKLSSRCSRKKIATFKHLNLTRQLPPTVSLNLYAVGLF